MNERLIVTLEQTVIDPSLATDDRENYTQRRAARAVLFDAERRVALLYIRQKDYYKLPGGGIEQGEEIHQALARELLEETGAEATVTQDLGKVEEWWDAENMHQISYAFVAHTTGEIGEPQFVEHEVEQGFEMAWVENIEEAIALVKSKLRTDELRIFMMSTRDVAILHTIALTKVT